MKPNTPEEYIEQLSEDRRKPMGQLRKTIQEKLPKGYKETISYGMIGYVVPHDIYPEGYHCDPKLPWPFISIASQKKHLALYHMGLYTDLDLLEWFKTEYSKISKTKLDMGKSCIRFKKMEQIPFKLIRELVTIMSVKEWIEIYKQDIRK